MISAIFHADISTHGWLALVSILLIVGGLALLAAIANATMRSLRMAHDEQEQKLSQCGLTGRAAAGRLLAHVGLSSDCIEEGAKIDHYDQLHKRLRLRTQSCVSSSVAALAVAAHEVGHAEQFTRGYWAAHATRCLLVLFVAGAAVLFVYPFATTIAGTGEVNLTSLLVLLALVAVLRLPLTFALELDATRRGLRLLGETSLAHEIEQEGIAHMLRAGFRVHVVISLAIVLLIGAGVAVMWLVENGLGT
jgi:Zn-dependent membrane protease YugP